MRRRHPSRVARGSPLLEARRCVAPDIVHRLRAAAPSTHRRTHCGRSSGRAAPIPRRSGRRAVTDLTPRLAITMGDPAGVGPEIIVKACRRLKPRLDAGDLRLLVIGHRTQLHAACKLLHETLEFPETDNAPLGFLAAADETTAIRFGEIAPEAGRFAYLAMERAVDLAMSGRIDAIVTAPLNKEALNLAGYHFAGHTDMLSALTKTPGSIMLLAHGDMRVGHVTTHVALADVPRLLTPERLRRTIDVTYQAVRDLGIGAPRVAVAALNPHAGEGGLFGRQD